MTTEMCRHCPNPMIYKCIPTTQNLGWVNFKHANSFEYKPNILFIM